MPFTRLLQAVCDNAAVLPRPIVVQHGHTPFDDPACEAVPFLKMEDFQHRVAEATLVILHGGAGSIITALQAGKRPLVMARRSGLGEHVDDHQQELVRELGAAGRIVVVEDADALRERVKEALALRSPACVSQVSAHTRMEGLVARDLAEWDQELKELG